MNDEGKIEGNISLPRQKLTEFCRKHHIQKLAFFGSVLRDDFGPDSDVDVLVEFEPGHVPGLAFFGMQREPADMLGRKVDLHTAADLSPRFRNEVLNNLEYIFKSAQQPGFICHREGNVWVGWLETRPDYRTQGATLEELEENLRDITEAAEENKE